MDIKDSYLHGTVGVVKSISVTADKLKYKLADKKGTSIEVTMPTATQSANGLLSSADKKKLDNMIATKVANDLILKIDSGTTEGTSLYTYNGSTAKTLDIKSGTGIAFSKTAGALQIFNSGVRSIATGTTNGTISVNTNGTSKDVAVKGLGSAAYTTSGSYVQLGYLGSITDVVDLYSKLKSYFGDNHVSITKLKDERGIWGHLLSKFQNPDLGLYGVDGCGLFLTGSSVERWSIGGKNTTDDPLVYNKYKIYDEGNLGIVSSSANGLAPKVINTNTSTIGSAYYVLASTNGSATPSWYKLPATAFANDDTKVTQTNTTSNASYRVLFSGNANDTTETTTARKSANLLFNPSTGNLTTTSLKLNGNIIINDGTNKDRYIQWLYNNTNEYSWRIGYLGSGGANNNFLVFDSYREKQGWATALKFEHTTMIAHFGATVNAPTFQGNLDGTYVNKLTNYKIANAIGSIAAADSLNTALGKLEFKTDFIYNDLFGTDNDDVINKWHEIVDFIDSVKEGTDITDEFVTRKTELTITGKKSFTTDITLYTPSGDSPNLIFLRNGLNTDDTVDWKMFVTGGFFKLQYSATSTNSGAWTDIISVSTYSTSSITTPYKITAAKFITSGGTSSLFVKGDGSLDSNTYATTTSLGNYLPLAGGTLTGRLTISNDNWGSLLVLNRNNNGSNWGPAILFNIEGSNVGTLTMASDNLYIGNNGSIRYRAWHEGNDGSGSGLDADLLDGTHKADLFTSLTNVNTKANPYSLSATIGGTTKYLQVAHSKNTLNLNAERFDTDAPLPNTYTGLTFQFSNNVDQGWSNVLTMRSYNDYNYTCAQIITPANNPSKDTGYSGDMKWRLGRNSTWLDWKTILDSSNTHIKSGVITINGTAITPLTQHQSLTNYVTLDTNQNITGYKTFKRDTTAFTIQSSTGNSTIKFVNSGMTSWFGFSSARSLFYTDDKWEEAYYVLSSANYNSYLPVKLINDPGRTVLIASYGLNANYGTGDYGNPVEEYLMAFSKYLLDKAAGYTCIGYIQPGSRGSYICDIYNNGTNSTTGLPVHITGHFFPHGGTHYHFGTSYGTWYWYTALHSANYTNYTVTKTGGGASGTWGISITGNAATATTASKVTCQEQSSDKDRPIVLTNTSNLLYYSTKATVNYSSGHIKAGALTINSVLDYSAYPETDTLKMGTTMGSIHFNGDLEDKGSAITWGYSSYGSADSGIYVKHDGSYGSKMYFATANEWIAGPKAAMLIDSVGDIYALRGNFVGTLKGSVISNLTTGSHLAGNKGTAIINSTASGNGYTMLAKMNSSNGVFCQGSYNDAYKLFYTANTVISEGTNTFTYGATLLDEDGNSTFPGTVNVRNLKITSTALAKHLTFSRGGYNYISAPSGGIISFMVNGKTDCNSANCELVIQDGYLNPGTDNVTALGTVTLRWSNIYSVLGNFSGQITSTVATGTAPFAISSTTKVDNLNADMLDGLDETAFIRHRGNIDVDYVNLENYEVNATGFAKLSPGVYSVQRSGYSDTLIHFLSSGSTSAIELMSNYSDTSRLKVRKVIDGKRVSGPWRELAWLSDLTWNNISGKPTITNYYWANVKISDSSSTTTAPTFGSVTTSTIKSDNTILYLKYKNDDTKSIALTDTAFTPTNAATDKINLGTSSNRWKSLYTSKLFIDNTGKLMPIDTNSRSAGVYGVYDPTKVGHVWSMGSNYKISDDGRSTNTMYGLVYFHTKWSNSTEYNTATRGDKLITEVDVYASGHLIAMVSNGTVVSSLGDYVWSRYGFKKFNSSDSYVLLGGGGHKTISSLSVASATTANSLKSTAIVTDKAFSLVNTKWTDVDGTYDNLAVGTYAVQITSGSDLVASGIMSYKNSSDTAGDEIPLHVHSTVNWRPYLRTYDNKLLISSNDTSAASRTVTIKIALIL